MYRRLGTLEARDQLAYAAHLRAQPWTASVSVFGWSFGGYLATRLALEGTWAAAVAVAPVVDWALYDSVWTERYMDTPAANAAGYRSASLLLPQLLPHLAATPYLLCHGLADDNVHFANSATLDAALVAAGIAFDMKVYTDADHSIDTPGARRHLWTAVELFLSRSPSA